MNSRIAAITVAGTLVSAVVLAQQPGLSGAGGTFTPSKVLQKLTGGKKSAANAPRDPDVKPANTVLEPTPLDQLQPGNIALPEVAIEPYLLTRENGPFMVHARTFRGSDAERYALALVLELRNDYGLPAYVLRKKDFPHGSYIRNTPPTAPSGMPKPDLQAPERYRSYDEASVLVGNEKTIQDANNLLHRVKKIRPKCLKDMPTPFHWRNNTLKYALVTANPFVPAQDLFPGRRDRLVDKMNEGSNSIYHCPGRYSLEIASFSGRSTFDVKGAEMAGLNILKKSPLATAADDAERLAENLAKIPEIQSTGQPLYVYHDRQSSRVFIGAFNSPNDPNAAKLREYLVKNAVMIMDRKDAKTGRPIAKYNRGIDKMIVPATFLTDLDNPDLPLRPQGTQLTGK